MSGISLRREMVDPLECPEGCYPPFDPMRGRDGKGGIVELRCNQTRKYKDGDRWVCEHGTAYEAFDPSNYARCYMFRKWRKLRGGEARRARREAGIEVGRWFDGLVMAASIASLWLVAAWGYIKELVALWVLLGLIIYVGSRLYG